MDTAERIAGLPLFAGLPRVQHEALARIVIGRSYVRGQIIFSDGDEGAGFYAILSGRVKVFRLSPEGKEQIYHVFGAGETFGEVSVFSGQGFPAFAKALVATEAIFFPRDAFMGLIRGDLSLALNMLAVLSTRLRRFAAMIEDLSLKEVPGRLAAYLLFLSEKEGNMPELALDVTKGQLASLLGTVPETLSRILTRMARQGLIRIRGGRIRILDRKLLEEIATEGRKLIQ